MAQQSQILLKTYEEQYSKLFWSVKQEKGLFNQEAYLSRIQELESGVADIMAQEERLQGVLSKIPMAPLGSELRSGLMKEMHGLDLYLNSRRELIFSEHLPNLESFSRKELTPILAQEGLSRKEFNRLVQTPVDELTQGEADQLKRIRELVPKITTDTLLSKVISNEDAVNYYLSGKSHDIGGFFAREVDVGHAVSFPERHEALRTDYPWTLFKLDQEGYFEIEFKLNEKTLQENKVSIPYSGEKFGSNRTPSPPETGNGFVASRTGEIIPEWELSERVTPTNGSRLVFKKNDGTKVEMGRWVDGNLEINMDSKEWYLNSIKGDK